MFQSHLSLEKLNRGWKLESQLSVKKVNRGWKLESQLSVESNDCVVEAEWWIGVEKLNRGWKLNVAIAVKNFPGKLKNAVETHYTPRPPYWMDNSVQLLGVPFHWDLVPSRAKSLELDSQWICSCEIFMVLWGHSETHKFCAQSGA